jgi:O-antigen ligase
LTLVGDNTVLPSRGTARRWDGAAAKQPRVAAQDRFALGTARLAICGLPVLLPNGPANLTPVDLLIMPAVGSTLLWSAYTHERLTVPYRLGVGAMVSAGLVSGLLGRWPGLALLSIVQDIFLLAWAASLATLLRGAAEVAVLLRTWVWSSAAWGVAFVVTTTRSAVTAGPDASRVSFTFGDENAAGLYFVLSLLIMLATGRPRSRGARMIIGAVLLLATLYTGSLGAISGVLLAAACGVVLGVGDRRGLAAGVAVAASLLLATASVTVLVQRSDLVQAAHNSPHALIRNSLGREAQSSSERAVLRGESVQLWRASDVFGAGPASTKDLLEAEQAPYAKEAHNDWLATLIERGLLGAIGLLLLSFELALRGHRIWARSRLDDALSEVLVRPAYLTGGLACVLAFSVTHEVLHDRTVWCLFGIVAAAAFVTRQPHRATGGI